MFTSLQVPVNRRYEFGDKWVTVTRVVDWPFTALKTPTRANGMIISLAKEFTAIAFEMPDHVDPLHAADKTKVSRMTVAPSKDCSASARFDSRKAS
jgi:hypothetical protein